MYHYLGIGTASEAIYLQSSHITCKDLVKQKALILISYKGLAGDSCRQTHTNSGIRYEHYWSRCKPLWVCGAFQQCYEWKAIVLRAWSSSGMLRIVQCNESVSATSNNCRIFAADPISPDGGIGRRVGLKHQWTKVRAGSIPALGTMKRSPLWSSDHSGDRSFSRRLVVLLYVLLPQK